MAGARECVERGRREQMEPPISPLDAKVTSARRSRPQVPRQSPPHMHAQHTAFVPGHAPTLIRGINRYIHGSSISPLRITSIQYCPSERTS